ncbi:hypothetical protein Hte_005870 [Hypoxylon texense]
MDEEMERYERILMQWSKSATTKRARIHRAGAVLTILQSEDLMRRFHKAKEADGKAEIETIVEGILKHPATMSDETTDKTNAATQSNPTEESGPWIKPWIIDAIDRDLPLIERDAVIILLSAELETSIERTELFRYVFNVGNRLGAAGGGDKSRHGRVPRIFVEALRAVSGGCPEAQKPVHELLPCLSETHPVPARWTSTWDNERPIVIQARVEHRNGGPVAVPVQALVDPKMPPTIAPDQNGTIRSRLEEIWQTISTTYNAGDESIARYKSRCSISWTATSDRMMQQEEQDAEVQLVRMCSIWSSQLVTANQPNARWAERGIHPDGP